MLNLKAKVSQSFNLSLHALLEVFIEKAVHDRVDDNRAHGTEMAEGKSDGDV